MKILVKEVNKKATMKEVESLSLSDMQKLVGGYIESLFITPEICMWMNEEGKILGLDPNLIIINDNHEMLDVVSGDVFFTGIDKEKNTVGLTDIQVKILQSRFGQIFPYWVDDQEKEMKFSQEFRI